MTTNTVVLQGVVTPDGRLQLEDRIPLRAGKVSVTLEPIPYSEETDPLLVMLRRIWAAREQGGKPVRSGEEAQAALRHLRDSAAEEVAEASRLQEECRRLREADGRKKEPSG